MSHHIFPVLSDIEYWPENIKTVLAALWWLMWHSNTLQFPSKSCSSSPCVMIMSYCSLWGNSYDHSSYDHTRWRTSATVSSGRAWLWHLHATETHIICTQYRYAIFLCSWPEKTPDNLIISVISPSYFLAKWSQLLRCNDRNCKKQTGKHDRNFRRMIVTVGLRP